MTEIAEAYPLPTPLKPVPPGTPGIPPEAYKTHRVIYAYSAITLPRASVRAQSFALAEKGFAERLVASGRARFETDKERQVAIDNRHQRYVGGAPKAKADGDGDAKPAKPARRAKPGKADGKSG